ncbi:MAG: hypothetical protein EBU59_13070, partial [Planctomycetia bacterium]|nr:hypothetical protein [Planctomycetia bacterium]
ARVAEFTLAVTGETPPPPPPTDGPVTVSGRVTYAGSNAAIPGATIRLTTPGGEPDTSTLVGSSITNTTGGFSFTTDSGLDYRLAATKSGDIRGITAHDAALVLSHLAETADLTEWQLRGADYDGSGAVTVFDAGLILRESLGGTVATMADAGRSWVFGPRSLSLPGLETNATGQDFTGLLIGDVSTNWASGQPTPTGTPVQVRLSSPDIARGYSNTFTMSLAGGDASVISANLTIQFDPAVLTIRPEDIQSQVVGQRALVAARSIGPGQLAVAIASAAALPREVPLISVTAKAEGNTSGSPIAVTAASLNEGSVAATLGSASVATLTPIDEIGSVRLGKGRDGTVYANGRPLKLRGAQARERVFGAFSIVEAETEAGKNMAHVRRDDGRTYRWELSDNWEFDGIETIGNVGNTKLPRADRGEAFELPVRTPVETAGAVELSRDAEGFLYAGSKPVIAASG